MEYGMPLLLHANAYRMVCLGALSWGLYCFLFVYINDLCAKVSAGAAVLLADNTYLYIGHYTPFWNFAIPFGDLQIFLWD